MHDSYLRIVYKIGDLDRSRMSPLLKDLL
jgi:hypothetical protein